MSIRMRLMASIVLALLCSLVVSGCLAWLRAARSVRTELAAAMEVAEQSTRNGIDDIAHSLNPQREPARLVETFDGERHVIATLVDPATGAEHVSHRLISAHGVPAWFVWLVAPPLAPVRVDVPAAAGGGTIVLRAEPTNEASEAWEALGDSGFELLVFSVLAGGLTLLTTNRALRPLDTLTAALDRLGPGHFGLRVVPAGPSDLIRLAHGFNRLSDRLAAVEAQNGRLSEQMQRIQDEERADLAQRLHDDVGPFLFSISVSTAAVETLARAGEAAAIPTQTALIREDVGHVQKQVRDMLMRLRPVPPLAFGLSAATQELASFWQARHLSVAIEVAIAATADEAPEAVQETLYRVIQEAVSNAMRHAHPRHVRVAVEPEADGFAVRVVDDGGPAQGAAPPGSGLAALRNRVAAAGGRIAAGPRQDGVGGWSLSAFVPAAPPEALVA